MPTVIPDAGPLSAELACATLTRLAPLGPAILPVPEDFRARRGEKLPVELAFHRRSLGATGELRWTTMTSARADIIALMIFPSDPELLPVFAAEFVVMAGRCKAAVVDLQSAANNPAARVAHGQALDDLGPRYAPLRSAALPEWCHDHFTANAIAALSVDMAHCAALVEGYGLYLDRYVSLARAATAAPAGEHAGLRHYKDHHIAHTPGRPFMTAAFGGEWTERFLRHGMYA